MTTAAAGGVTSLSTAGPRPTMPARTTLSCTRCPRLSQCRLCRHSFWVSLLLHCLGADWPALARLFYHLGRCLQAFPVASSGAHSACNPDFSLGSCAGKLCLIKMPVRCRTQPRQASPWMPSSCTSASARRASRSTAVPMAPSTASPSATWTPAMSAAASAKVASPAVAVRPRPSILL